MDVYFLLEISESKIDTCVYAGELHNRMLIKFLLQPYSNSWPVKINTMGYLDKSDVTVPAYVVDDSPSQLLYGGSGLAW